MSILADKYFIRAKEKLQLHKKCVTKILNVTAGVLSDKIKVTFADGVTYNGQFSGKAFSGEGTMLFPNIGTYEGDFKNNKRDGYGKFEWSDGIKYEGNWTNDVYNGTGKYYFDTSTYLSGTFDNGKLNGNYKYHNSDGTFDTTWENGKCTSIDED